jgi:hypothetical protein
MKHGREIIAYVILFSEPADQYSPAVHILRKGNPVGLDPSSEIRGAECAPCAGSNLTLEEKITRLNHMVLVEDNQDDTSSMDDREYVLVM